MNDTRLLRVHSVRMLEMGAEHKCLCHMCTVVRAKHEIKHFVWVCAPVCVRALGLELFNVLIISHFG